MHRVICIPTEISLSFYNCDVFLGTLWSSIKQVKAPYLFEGNMELLCMQCRGIGPHHAARAKSHGFSHVVVGNWCIFSSYTGDDPSKLVFAQGSQNSSLVMRDTSGIFLQAWHGNTDTSRGEAGDPGSLSSCHSDTGIPINFQQVRHHHLLNP